MQDFVVGGATSIHTLPPTPGARQFISGSKFICDFFHAPPQNRPFFNIRVEPEFPHYPLHPQHPYALLPPAQRYFAVRFITLRFTTAKAHAKSQNQ
jgi:hypothetical protein